MGRRSEPNELLHKLEASEQARERVKVMLLTLSGQWSVTDGLERLRISRTRFQHLRRRMLQQAVWALETRARGRPRRPAQAEGAAVAGLRDRIEQLTHELRVVRAALEISESPVAEAVRQRIASLREPQRR